MWEVPQAQSSPISFPFPLASCNFWNPAPSLVFLTLLVHSPCWRVKARPAVLGSLTLSEPGTREGKATPNSQGSKESSEFSAQAWVCGHLSISAVFRMSAAQTCLSFSLPCRILEG